MTSESGTFNLSSTLDSAMLITIQPVGVTYIEPAPITFPNFDDLEPETDVDIWSVDPDLGEFVVVGTGRVTAVVHGILLARLFLVRVLQPGKIAGPFRVAPAGSQSGNQRNAGNTFLDSVATRLRNGGNFGAESAIARYRD